jgi:uncharacterized protein YceK
MKTKITVLLLATVICLSGCGVGMSKPSDGKAEEMIQKTVYVKDDRAGVCYAMVSTHHQMQVSDDGMSMTSVPCTDGVLAHATHASSR